MGLDRNRRLALVLAAIVAVMVGMSFAAVPLYRVFCRATGFGGTTQRAAEKPAVRAMTEQRLITVSFNTDVAPDLPWEFTPPARKITLPVGEAVTVRFHARNLARHAIVGTAVYNAQPGKIGIYFNKTECFCFQEQLLQPGQNAEFPVTFFIDPDMAKDRALNDVHDMVLSYTFFMAKDQGKAKPAASP